jgi:hypothetical protein
MSKERRAALLAISNALIQTGISTLDAQSRALGLSRSTAWTVVSATHKTGRLSPKTTQHMLANPALPVQVRAAVEAYVNAFESEKPVGQKRGRHGKV